MQLDTTITIGNIFTILAMIFTIVSVLAKYKHDLGNKAEKRDVAKIETDYKHEVATLENELKLLSSKIDYSNKKLDEIKKEITEQQEKYNKLYNELLIIKTEHDKNHK